MSEECTCHLGPPCSFCTEGSAEDAFDDFCEELDTVDWRCSAGGLAAEAKEVAKQQALFAKAKQGGAEWIRAYYDSQRATKEAQDEAKNMVDGTEEF